MAEVSKVRISGTGMYVPDRVVTNFDLEKMMDTSDEWIRQRSGIAERRWVEEGTTPSDLGLKAANMALEEAGLEPTDIDFILVASLSPGFYFPGVSAFLQRKLGLSTTPALDLRAQCSGFLYGLQMGQSLIASGVYKKILLVGAEVHSGAIDCSTRGRDVAVLFGDGAGAVVLERSENQEQGILSCHLHSQGEHAEQLCIRYPGTAQKPYSQVKDIEEASIYPSMNGRHVFKNATTRMPEVVREALEANKVDYSEVDAYLFHQANLRINEMVLKQLEQPAEKTLNNIQKYGNCSAASVPMVLHEARQSGLVGEGKLVCMAGFGAGYTWGSALVRF